MEDFILYKRFPSGGTVSLMTGLDRTNSDYHDLIEIASFFARIGKDVRVLTPIHYKDPEYSLVFGPLMGTPYERKCPDLMIGGQYYEYESYVRPWTKRKLSNMISHGVRQSNYIIIDGRGCPALRLIIRRIHSRINIHTNIKEVWIYDGVQVVLIYP